MPPIFATAAVHLILTITPVAVPGLAGGDGFLARRPSVAAVSDRSGGNVPAGPLFLGPAGSEGCRWRWPADAPIVDPFRPPSHPYGPGNRGVELGATPGQSVVAVADGTVTFAGPVAGGRWIVVEHPNGLRSTLGPLESVAVVVGQRVDAGAVLGRSGSGLHLTARSGDRYLDPQPLLEGRCGHPRLVAPQLVAPHLVAPHLVAAPAR